jgi:hypothetical protein
MRMRERRKIDKIKNAHIYAVAAAAVTIIVECVYNLFLRIRAHLCVVNECAVNDNGGSICERERERVLMYYMLAFCVIISAICAYTTTTTQH